MSGKSNIYSLLVFLRIIHELTKRKPAEAGFHKIL